MADAIQFVEANGLKFAYIEEGSGPLVLLLHGFPDTAHTWDDLRPRIAANGYRAVSPFMRGYHPSAIPDRDPDPETLAHDPLALIEALGAARRHRHWARLWRRGRIRRGGARPGSSEKAVRHRHSAPGGAAAVAEAALARTALCGVQTAGRVGSVRAQRLRGATGHLSAMVARRGSPIQPSLTPSARPSPTGRA